VDNSVCVIKYLSKHEKMKQTALQWLLENLITEPFSEEHFKYNNECWDKAEEMEKEHIIESYCQGCFDITKDEDIFPRETAEQYYNKTYKK
jgi:hypothetical protein